MDPLDLVVLVLLVLAAGAGHRRGLSLVGMSLVGLLAGVAAGAMLATVVPMHLSGLSVTARSAVAIGLLVGGAMIGNAAGGVIGVRLRRSALRTPLGRLDSWLGSAAGAAATLLLVWLLGLVFSTGPIAPLSAQIQGSVILRSLDAHVPRPPGVFAALQQLLAGVPFPEVFVNLVPSLPGPVPLPGSLLAHPGVRQGIAATVRVVSSGCGGIEEGSGFPIAPDRILTNAHVVAGSTLVAVQPPTGGTLSATVVLFDPRRDLAVLRVPGLDLAPLRFAPDRGRGSSGAVIGYPGGGPERAVPAAVRGTLDAVGRDIYAAAIVTRQIEVLDAQIRPGNSGGPFLSPGGRVLGVVFAKSTVTPDLGFALSSREVEPDVRGAGRRRRPVSTQGCVS
ncbi:MAG TPA: MarP family serine protease [Verrucomicrobiae bacterium]|nr:MarP family serine protease [Verrucomicrobiae bacterium]